MKILLLDTCGETGSIALADAHSAIASAILPGRTASERLLPAIRDLAAANAVPLASLGAVVVIHGPGSFTGVRVGLSAAKGLCDALGLPLVAISRLAVLAHSAAAPPQAPILAVLDAGRGEFYAGLYRDGVCQYESLLTREEILAQAVAAEPIQTVVCEQSVAESLAALTPQQLPQPVAETALPLALARIHSRAFDDIATIDANYVRRTDAEIFAKPTARTQLPGTPVR